MARGAGVEVLGGAAALPAVFLGQAQLARSVVVLGRAVATSTRRAGAARIAFLNLEMD